MAGRRRQRLACSAARLLPKEHQPLPLTALTSNSTAAVANNARNSAIAMKDTMTPNVYLRGARGSALGEADVCADAGGVSPGWMPPPRSMLGVLIGSGSGGSALTKSPPTGFCR